MIFALFPFGHIDSRDGHGSRCLWPANLQQRSSVARGMVVIGVIVGDDSLLVGVELVPPVRQVAAVLIPQLTTI